MKNEKENNFSARPALHVITDYRPSICSNNDNVDEVQIENTSRLHTAMQIQIMMLFAVGWPSHSHNSQGIFFLLLIYLS